MIYLNEENKELDLREELQCKQNYIVELENTLDSCEQEIQEYKKEIKTMESKLYQIDSSSCKIECMMNLQKQLDEKNNIILQLTEKGQNLGAASLSTSLEKFSEEKQARICELEEALRESMIISTKREKVLHQEESKRRKILEKVRYFSTN